jgi:predicted flap endonuclease-1-like 5' DNA nuclease
MAFKIRHLVTVEELPDDAVQPAKVATVRPVKTTLVVTAAPEQPAAKAPAVAAPEQPDATPTVAETPVVAATPVLAETLPVAEDPAVVEEPEVAETPAKADDLELIEGIGPKIAAVLMAAGIVTFADLAAADTSRLAEILEQEPNLRLADSGTWPEQAALAAAGKWDEFKVLAEQLKGGRRV